MAIYFFATGSVWQGSVLTAYGVGVIGLVDNMLRPILVGKDTKMPDYVVLVSTLGGMTSVRSAWLCHRAGDRRIVHRLLGPFCTGRQPVGARLRPPLASAHASGAQALL